MMGPVGLCALKHYSFRVFGTWVVCLDCDAQLLLLRLAVYLSFGLVSGDDVLRGMCLGFCNVGRAGPLLANDLEAVQSMVNRFYQEVSLSFEGTSDAVLAEHIVEHTVPVVGAVDHETMDDMSRPLAQYYVYTSHNTYLEGPQVFR